jgi:hypothetical protein
MPRSTPALSARTSICSAPPKGLLRYFGEQLTAQNAARPLSFPTSNRDLCADRWISAWLKLVRKPIIAFST